MAAINVHGSVLSTATQRVLVCLYEKGLGFEFVPVDMKAGAHKQEPFLSINVSAKQRSLALFISVIVIFVSPLGHIWLESYFTRKLLYRNFINFIVFYSEILLDC